MRSAVTWWLCSAGLSTLSMAQTPAGLLPIAGRAGGIQDPLPPPPLNPGDEIYNTLHITDSQAYCNGNGDAWAGRGVIGLYDLQFVDDVRIDEDCCLSVLVRDHLTFFGGAPADGYYVALYAEAGDCVPNEAAACDQLGAGGSVVTFRDTIFGLIGTRSTVQTNGLCCVPAGNYFVEIQPHDETSMSDWYYAVRDCSLLACDCHMRDGGRARSGYGTTTWISSGQYGYGVGTLAQAVSVKCAPPPTRCVYQVTDVKLMSTACGRTCDACEYTAGDFVCTHDCHIGQDDCPDALRGFSACGNGAACKAVARFWDCATCPPGAKRCR